MPWSYPYISTFHAFSILTQTLLNCATKQQKIYKHENQFKHKGLSKQSASASSATGKHLSRSIRLLCCHLNAPQNAHNPREWCHTISALCKPPSPSTSLSVSLCFLPLYVVSFVHPHYALSHVSFLSAPNHSLALLCFYFINFVCFVANEEYFLSRR